MQDDHDGNDDFDPERVMPLAIDGVLDLHTFDPASLVTSCRHGSPSAVRTA